MKRRTLLERGAWSSLLLVAGCGGDSSQPSGPGGSDSASPGAPGAVRPTGGGTLTVATADDIKSLDTAVAYDTWSTSVVHACTRRLVDYNPAGELIPDLAEKWDVSADGVEYRFHLKPGQTYADGAQITAAHFKAALDRVRDPKVASPGASFYSGIKSITAPSAVELVVTLKAAEPTFLNVVGLTFAAPVKPGGKTEWPSPSGPYQIESYEQGDKVVLTRNPSHEAAREWVERIVVQLKVEEALQLTRFKGGEVDLLGSIPAAEWARISADRNALKNVVQDAVNQTWYLGFNTQKDPWKDVRVRRAAGLAIDRARLKQFAGPSEPASGILPPHVPGASPDRAVPQPAPEGAKKLLAEAGFPTGLPKASGGTLWLADNERYRRIAEAIQSDLAGVGIPIELRAVTFREYLEGYRKQADCWFGGWYPDYPDAGNFLEPVLHSRAIPPKGSNAARYRSQSVDSLLDTAHKTPAGDDRNKLYLQAEMAILNDAPWIPLLYEVEARYFREGVTGVSVHPVRRQILTGISKSS